MNLKSYCVHRPKWIACNFIAFRGTGSSPGHRHANAWPRTLVEDPVEKVRDEARAIIDLGRDGGFVIFRPLAVCDRAGYI
ncbi:MAG: hypothetical protein KJZ78_27050 [Bryobacteraceae bacterium]|nr:hypothetical protein [Bryobacteraceae bacterium]